MIIKTWIGRTIKEVQVDIALFTGLEVCDIEAADCHHATCQCPPVYWFNAFIDDVCYLIGCEESELYLLSGADDAIDEYCSYCPPYDNERAHFACLD
jgi:hypothetical protein